LVCGCNEEAEEEEEEEPEEQQEEFYIATQEKPKKQESHSSATTTTTTTTTTALRGDALRPPPCTPLPLFELLPVRSTLPSNKNRPTLGTHCGARSQHVGRPSRRPRVYLETWHALRPHCAFRSFTGCPFAARYLAFSAAARWASRAEAGP